MRKDVILCSVTEPKTAPATVHRAANMAKAITENANPPRPTCSHNSSSACLCPREAA